MNSTIKVELIRNYPKELLYGFKVHIVIKGKVE